MAEQQGEPGQQQTALAPPPGSVADLFQKALPDVEFTASQTALDVALSVKREDLPRVMQMAKEDGRLAFDFLRCLSGVDTYQDLEVVYHLYSLRRGHAVQIKASCTYDDPHMPTVSHLWRTADWHERETAELFGIVFDGHPDLRPLLTEEGLGTYILRKSHPLAEIEEWQEDYLKLAMEAEAKAQAAAAGAPAEVDERAAKVALAQKKAEIIKKAREEARAKGLPMEEEKAFVKAALNAFEEEQAKAAPPPAPAAAPVEDRAAKVALAQKKAEIIKKAREEARAKGLPMEEEKAFVKAALNAFEEEQAKAAPPPAAPPAPAAPPPQDRAAKVALAQKKAQLIKKAREEARARGMSMDEERRFVSEALKKFVAEQGEG
ncbi:MAG: NADH-quinone oxidoreductase subunit C [Dehalococcoidia bacterium]